MNKQYIDSIILEHKNKMQLDLELDIIIENMELNEIIYHLKNCGVYNEVITEGVGSAINKIIKLYKSANSKVRLSNAGVGLHNIKKSIIKKSKWAANHPIKATTKLGIHAGGQIAGQALPLHPIKGIKQSYIASKNAGDVITADLSNKIAKVQVKKAIKNAPENIKKAFIYSVENTPKAIKYGIENTPKAIKYSAEKTKEGAKYVGNQIKKHPIEATAHMVNGAITPTVLKVPGAYAIRGSSKYIAKNKGHVVKSMVSDTIDANKKVKDYVTHMKSPANIGKVPTEVWNKVPLTDREKRDYMKSQIAKKKGLPPNQLSSTK